MTRARNIKPGLFKNEVLGTEDPLLTLLFVSLWLQADREGRLEFRPQRIKAEAFPYREDVTTRKVAELLWKLNGKGFITCYEITGIQVIQVNNFDKHQNPHHREKESVLPVFGPEALLLKEPGQSPVQAQGQALPFPVVKRSDSLIPDSLIPDSLIPELMIRAPRKTDEGFEQFWKLYPKRPGSNKTKAAKKWAECLKAGNTVLEMQRGADKYRRYCEAMKTEGNYILAAHNFLADKQFLSDWKPVGQRGFMDRLLGDDGEGHGSIIDI